MKLVVKLVLIFKSLMLTATQRNVILDCWQYELLQRPTPAGIQGWRKTCTTYKKFQPYGGRLAWALDDESLIVARNYVISYFNGTDDASIAIDLVRDSLTEFRWGVGPIFKSNIFSWEPGQPTPDTSKRCAVLVWKNDSREVVLREDACDTLTKRWGILCQKVNKVRAMKNFRVFIFMLISVVLVLSAVGFLSFVFSTTEIVDNPIAKYASDYYTYGHLTNLRKPNQSLEESIVEPSIIDDDDDNDRFYEASDN